MGRETWVYPATLILEHRVPAAAEFLTRMVDPGKGGLPYFKVVLDGRPPVAQHDWPDWGDMTARFAEALAMARVMTGSDRWLPSERQLLELLLSFFGEDGLNYRARTHSSGEDALLFDQSRVLTTLVSWCMLGGDGRASPTTRRHIDALARITEKQGEVWRFPGRAHPRGGWLSGYDGGTGTKGAADPCYEGGVLLSPLLMFYDMEGYDPAFELARGLVNWVLTTNAIAEDGRFRDHVHSRLATAGGLIRYALLTGRDDILERGKRAVDFALGLSTAFGWVPEYVERPEGCEVCCIMDLLDCLFLLARAGQPQYYDVAERVVRNHLVESQLRDTGWLPTGPLGPDNDRSSTWGMPQRLFGAFAGWSAPNDFIGRAVWALMNCCTPAGIRALYLAWNEVLGGDWMTTRVNLLLNHAAESASVRSWLPAEGRVEVKVKQPKPVEIRVPDWVDHSQVKVTVDGTAAEFTWSGNYVKLGEYGKSSLEAGQQVTVTFPVRETTTTETRGGGTFTVHWRGDTVLQVDPAGVHCPLYARRAETTKAPEEREQTLVEGPGAIAWEPLGD
jgi:hypothetical protein